MGLSQDRAHEASTKIPQSLILRARKSHLPTTPRIPISTCVAETRKTYRAVFSEPTVVIPAAFAQASSAVTESQTQLPEESASGPVVSNANHSEAPSTSAPVPAIQGSAVPDGRIEQVNREAIAPGTPSGKKRARNDEEQDAVPGGPHIQGQGEKEGSKRKKKKLRSKEGQSG